MCLAVMSPYSWSMISRLEHASRRKRDRPASRKNSNTNATRKSAILETSTSLAWLVLPYRSEQRCSARGMNRKRCYIRTDKDIAHERQLSSSSFSWISFACRGKHIYIHTSTSYAHLYTYIPVYTEIDSGSEKYSYTYHRKLSRLYRARSIKHIEILLTL